MSRILHIGLDDTDTMQSGCTTYVAALLIERLLAEGACFIDYPNLIRLNPNVPWKTRGNGAVALRVATEKTDDLMDELWQIVIEHAEEEGKKPNPALLFLEGDIPLDIILFSRKAQREIASLDAANKLIEKYGVKARFKGRGIGLIGALAAIGEQLRTVDFTYEIIYYRPYTVRHCRRHIDAESVYKMDKLTKGVTFHNIDIETGRILITPRGPDPVIFGIRGDDPETLLKAAKIVKVYEEIERWVIYRTNQGTNNHLIPRKLSALQEHQAAKLRLVITSKPEKLPGGHVILRGGDGSNEIYLAFYRETGQLRMIAEQLAEGDIVEIWGGAKRVDGKLTLNVEGMRIEKVQQKFIVRRPRCPVCDGRMSSIGTGKGLKCKKCGYKIKKPLHLISIENRSLSSLIGKVLLPPPRSRRHLTKPETRTINKWPPKRVEQWFWSKTLKASRLSLKFCEEP